MPTFPIPEQYQNEKPIKDILEKQLKFYQKSDHANTVECYKAFNKMKERKQINLTINEFIQLEFCNSVSSFYMKKQTAGFKSCIDILFIANKHCNTLDNNTKKKIHQTIKNIFFYIDEIKSHQSPKYIIDLLKQTCLCIGSKKLLEFVYQKSKMLQYKKNVTMFIFTTSRYEYLIPTLKSLEENVDFSQVNVHKILICDYPKHRNMDILNKIKTDFKINKLVLNEENIGYSRSWGKAWKMVPVDTDYIWHQEEDFLFKIKVDVGDFIKRFEAFPHKLMQLSLKRNHFYKDTNDIIYKLDNNILGKTMSHNGLDILIQDTYFIPHPGIYPFWLTKQHYNYNPQEGVVIHQIKHDFPEYDSAILGKRDNRFSVEHIGEYNQGKRIAPGEPGWDWVKHYDPDKQYFSNGYLKEYKKEDVHENNESVNENKIQNNHI